MVSCEHFIAKPDELLASVLAAHSNVGILQTQSKGVRKPTVGILSCHDPGLPDAVKLPVRLDAQVPEVSVRRHVGVEKPISGWSHICLVYREGAPHIYINGEHIAYKTKSLQTIHPGLNFTTLKEGASYYNGDMSVPVLFSKVLSDKEISQLVAKGYTRNTDERILDWIPYADTRSLLI